MSNARYKLEAIKLLPSVKTVKSLDYPRLTQLYGLITKQNVRCSPCWFYTIQNYFKALETNIAKYKGKKKLKPIKR
jgi:hypothetical protein